MNPRSLGSQHDQRGATAIEFALVAVILFTLLFGIIEFGRIFFTINSMQEITRREAREQVFRLTSQPETAQCLAVLQQPGCGNTVNFPVIGDVTKADVRISLLNAAIVDHKLEEWEASEVVARPLGLLYRCLSPADPDREKIHERLAHLDPLLAMRVASDGSGANRSAASSAGEASGG